MIIDIIIAAAILIMAVFGYRKGFLKQAFTLVGILLVTFASAPIAGIIEHILADEFNIVLAGKHLQLMLLSATAAIIYIICFCLGLFLHDTLVKGIEVAEKTNHILGTILSILETIFAVYFILGTTAAYQDKIEKYAPQCNQVLNESVVFPIVKNNNLLMKYSFFNRNNTASNTNNTNTDNTKSDNTKSDNTKSDNTKSDNTKSDNTKSDNTKSDNSKSDSNKTTDQNTQNKTKKHQTNKPGTPQNPRFRK